MNLHNIVELTKSKANTSPTKSTDALSTLLQQFQGFQESAMVFLPNNHQAREHGLKIFNTKYAELRLDAFREYEGVLPETLETTKRASEEHVYNRGYEIVLKDLTDDLTKLSRSPHTSLAYLRDLADRLGFVFLPFDYFSKRAVEMSGSLMADSVQTFAKAVRSAGMVPYVLTPIQYYDVDRHVRSTDSNLDIYAGQHSQTIMAISLNIPMFVSIIETLGDLRDRVTDIDKRLTTVTANVKALQSQVERLERTVADVQEQQLAQRATQLQMTETLAAERSRASTVFTILDPMVVGLPKVSDLSRDDAVAVVGPCWGPDFPEIVAKIMGPVKRKNLEIPW